MQKEILNDAGFKDKVDYEYSDTIPENVVISQDPDSGSVEPGTRIKLVVSKGEEIKHVIMPNLVKNNIEKAKSQIKELGLEIGDITPQPSETIPKDQITWQSYEPGTKLETKTAVDLFISSGPRRD